MFNGVVVVVIITAFVFVGNACVDIVVVRFEINVVVVDVGWITTLPQ